MSELSRRDKAVSILIEVAKAFDEVVGGVGGSGFAYRLIDRQEDFEAYSLVGFVLMSEFLNVRLCGILAERPQSVADLRDVDLSVATAVEELERLLEFCISGKKNKQVNHKK